MSPKPGRLQAPAWLKAGIAGALFVFISYLIPLTCLQGLMVLAIPVFAGWLTVRLLNPPYQKPFLAGLWAGLVCSAGSLIARLVKIIFDPGSTIGIGVTLAAVALDALIMGVVSGLVCMLLANRKSPKSFTPPVSQVQTRQAAPTSVPSTPSVNESVLLRMRDSGDVDGLLSALKSRDIDVRHSAAARLGEMGEPRAFDPILSMLQDAHQRPGIVQVLGQLAFQMKTRGIKPDARAVEPLLALLDVPGVLENALFALGQFDDPRIAAVLGIPSDLAVFEALITETRAADPQKRLDATFKLKQDAIHVQNPSLRARIVDAFIDLINLPPSNEYGPSRYQAAMALGDLGDKRAVDPLITVLNDPGWMIRSEAAISLGKLKDRKAIPALEALLYHADDATRDSARKALAVLRG